MSEAFIGASIIFAGAADCDIFGRVWMKAGGPVANETVRQWEWWF